MNKKEKADGICGVCGNEVPSTNLNLFYCSEPCREEAWRFYNPDEVRLSWSDITEYALSFNGYNFVNGGPLELSHLYDKVANDPENASVDELKACLFFIQRAVRYSGDGPSSFDLEDARTFIKLIKSKT